MNVQDLLTEFGLRSNLSLVILTVALLLSRIIPVIVLSPFLGGDVVPNEVKIGIGVTLAVVLFPAVADRVHEVPISALPFIAVLFKELFIGLCLSFIVSMVFEAAQMAGTVVDTLAGTNMAQVMVPQLGTQVSLFSSLKLQLSIVLFLTLNGHHLVIQALGESLVAIPLDKFPAFSSGFWPFFELLIRVFADLLKVALALAAPAYLATFLADLALGMINRVAPQIQVYFISMSIKPLVATLMMLLVIHLVMGRVQLEFGHMFQTLRQAVRLLT